jgi:hypothetical protein
MPMRKTERRMGQVIGRITPGELLTAEAVMSACGIGESKLAELRAAGKLVAFWFNGRNWFESEQLIAVIKESKRA